MDPISKTHCNDELMATLVFQFCSTYDRAASIRSLHLSAKAAASAAAGSSSASSSFAAAVSASASSGYASASLPSAGGFQNQG